MDPRARSVLTLAQSGDIAAAVAAGEALVSEGLVDGPFLIFLGVMCGRLGNFERAIPYLQRGVALLPNEAGARIELGRAYLSAGQNDAAVALAEAHVEGNTPFAREMKRILGRALLGLERGGEAVAFFDELTTADAGDFESWDGLGVARLAAGDLAGAVTAAEKAVAIRPSAAGYVVNLSRALNAAGDLTRAEEAAKRAVAMEPRDIAAQLMLARVSARLRKNTAMAEAMASARSLGLESEAALIEAGDILFIGRAFEEAEHCYREAVRLNPSSQRGWLGVGSVLERLNRHEDLLSTLDAAEAAGVPAAATGLLRAFGLRGLKRWTEALEAAQRAPADRGAIGRQQLIGDLFDRLGDTEAAFEAWEAANGLIASADPAAEQKAEAYLDLFDRNLALLTPQSYARLRPIRPEQTRAAPLFIFGFPRSGTTLIDTMLSGHPDAVVMEEEPTIDMLSAEAGVVEGIADFTASDVRRLVDFYFRTAEQFAPDASGKLLVDKHPLGLGNTPLLHRLFPDARFIFVERHPCDVVLSCFITSAQMDANVASFHSFEGTARLYDRVLTFWTRCREVLPINVHTVKYEALIADTEAELRSIAEFAGLTWTPRMLDHEANASGRAYIGSPSYAQVAEPIYSRAKSRWLRYRDKMQSVFPILQPWIERMGYSLD